MTTPLNHWLAKFKKQAHLLTEPGNNYNLKTWLLLHFALKVILFLGKITSDFHSYLYDSF